MKTYGASNYDPNRRNNLPEKIFRSSNRKNAGFPGFWPKHAYKLKFPAENFYLLNRSSKSHSDIILGPKKPVGPTKVKIFQKLPFYPFDQKLI